MVDFNAVYLVITDTWLQIFTNFGASQGCNVRARVQFFVINLNGGILTIWIWTELSDVTHEGRYQNFRRFTKSDDILGFYSELIGRVLCQTWLSVKCVSKIGLFYIVLNGPVVHEDSVTWDRATTVFVFYWWRPCERYCICGYLLSVFDQILRSSLRNSCCDNW